MIDWIYAAVGGGGLVLGYLARSTVPKLRAWRWSRKPYPDRIHAAKNAVYQVGLDYGLDKGAKLIGGEIHVADPSPEVRRQLEESADVTPMGEGGRDEVEDFFKKLQGGF